jgi:long-chain acyl-CoA synthetase
MRRDTLLDFFDDLASRSGTFLVYDDGFRTRQWTYADVGHAAYAFASRLQGAGLSRGDKILIWGENRPEWIVAFWGALLSGVAVVPIDFRASADFLLKVRSVVDARIVLVGDDVTAPAAEDFTVWHLHDLSGHAAHHESSPAITTSREAREHHLQDVRARTTKDDVVEIIFTSGATAEPKGVVITHRNILANIVPIEREIVKYRRYARPFHPIRFLNLLPLSHMFGQAMATFVPPMLTGEVIFMRSYNPQEIMREIKTHRVSVLVSVPKLLDVLRDYVSRRFPHAATPDPSKMHFTKRWWKYRDVHRAFGWKFWSAVVGAAPLDPALEEYWGRLGFLVIQGYGLTETAPIVTLNHPFSAQKGSVGKPIHGVEVKIADDGEILVRGENVTTGYYGQPDATADAFQDGWLHTGDIGGVDDAGRVFIRGRKKEMIVTPEGLNVFPEDVERELNAIAGVREAAVVGRSWQGEERVHAVLVVEPGTDADAVVRDANAKLGDHQKIRSHAIWPSETLPRTEGTRKLKRREIKSWVDAGGAPDAVTKTAGRDESIESIVARFAKSRSGDDIGRDTTIDELGLSSLERVELLMALEERFQTTLDEAAYAEVKTIGDLHLVVADAVGSAAGRDDSSLHAEDFATSDVADRHTASPAAPDTADADDAAGASGAAGGGGTAPASRASKTLGAAAASRVEPVVFPSWNRTWPARAIRRVSLPTWILPLGRVFAWVEVSGLEHLEGLEGPVMFAANHQSHLDAPMILWALPARWRYRTAIAMAKEFFKAHFFPERHGRKAWATNSLNYYLASLFFNAFPLPQREAGTRQTLRYIGDLLSGGWNVLIFPEGKRTDQGEINPFRPGIGMIGARLGVPVVPVRLIGLEKVLHQKMKMAKPGPAKVIFGKPLMLTGDDYAARAKDVEDAVRALDGKS